QLLETARSAVREARGLAAEQQFAAALDRLQRVRDTFPDNAVTQEVAAELTVALAEIATARDEHLATMASATKRQMQKPHATPEGASPRVAAELSAANRAPVPSVRPEIDALVVRGRSQYLAGDHTAAAQTFVRVLEHDPFNGDANAFLQRIARGSIDRNAARAQTTAQLLNEVERAWKRPSVYREPPAGSIPDAGLSPLVDKLNKIILPSVSFSGMELGRVVNTLSVISEEFDQSGTTPKGVNIVLVDSSNANPPVSITLRNLSLKRVLDFITDSVGYQYEVQPDAIVVRSGGEISALETQFFPVSRSTVLRMTGRSALAQSRGGDALTGGEAAQNIEGEGQAIRKFLQLAGVSFDDVEGSTLAFDGSQLIVTQTLRNLVRLRNILARYSEVRQVEIEAKFMEVQDGALEELGINWNIGKKATQHSGASVTNYTTGNRSLAGAFSNNVSGTPGAIIRPAVAETPTTNPQEGINLPITSNPPPIPGMNNLGLGAMPLAAVTGILGEFNVNAVIRALSQRSGTELLSAPKLTVLSGHAATITVAQELRYPQSYGQVQSQVGTGSASGGGSAGVTITAGTPQDFATRNIGVELRVTPTVEEDDYSVSLDLNPRVTEFEGFVEYGGQSVAVSGSTTVTVPSGFYQPIFAVREVSTQVTIWDGATIVMGGLTREDTRKTNDKVPVIGNLPVLGRLFRSSGESAQKRNLLIFVTANLVSPGGSLKRQSVPGASAGAVFQNPTIVTPGGAESRTPVDR
ncbi:MAG: type II secretory pathway, component PulD, partial [Candidatus Didemnitutus sp.]|nr:type II secretory pathway, component PulD [Candidatus Didemnitutus sp.]